MPTNTKAQATSENIYVEISNPREMQLTLLRASSEEAIVPLWYNTGVSRLLSLSDFMWVCT